jgi:predicted ATP-grasp superfamily ATP-dependent carboligase
LIKYKLVAKERIIVIIQEIIHGPEDENYSIIGYFDKNHNPQALFACNRLRGWPKDFGNSSFIESCSLSKLKTIKDEIVKYLNQIGYSGVMEAEVKRDSHDGVFKLIEINARSWWQNSLPTRCGINIIYTAYLDSIGIKTPYSEQYRTGIYWMHPLNDLQFFLRFHPEKLGEWFGSLRKTEDFAFFCKYDMSPWIMQNLKNIVRIMERIFRRSSSPVL